ncbi:MAG: DUF6375 family protein [Paludibacter sp.]|nr:DUF6375 family protein [Paludibacter sp.]
MKIWKSFSSEHSAKLRITGTFKTVENANQAATAFNELLEKREVGDESYPFPEEIREVMNKYQVYLNRNAAEDLDYIYPLDVEGKKIVVETDDFAIQALSQVFIRYGAKIEIYSRHDY